MSLLSIFTRMFVETPQRPEKKPYRPEGWDDMMAGLRLRQERRLPHDVVDGCSAYPSVSTLLRNNWWHCKVCDGEYAWSHPDDAGCRRCGSPKHLSGEDPM